MVSRFGLWINGNSVETQQWDTIMDPYLGKPFAEVAVAGEPELEQDPVARSTPSKPCVPQPG